MQEDVAFQQTSLEYEDGDDGKQKNSTQVTMLSTSPDVDPDFRKKHQQYLAQKKARKLEAKRQIKIEFGESSSDQDDLQSGNASNLTKANMSKTNTQPVQTSMKVVVQSKNNPGQNQKYQVSIRLKKNSQWLQDNILFNKATLVLPNYSYYYKDFSKLKMFAETGIKDHCKIKITHQTSDQFFIGAPTKVQVKGISMHYYIFAKILCEKLALMGIQVKEPNIQQPPGIPQAITVNSSLYGKILKKSQMLGKWDERLVVINKEGIYSYKKFNEKHSMYIANGQIKQMWTRFEIIENMLIVKMEYGGTKTQFGIPITNFLSPTSKFNWLWQFYKKAIKV